MTYLLAIFLLLVTGLLVYIFLSPLRLPAETNTIIQEVMEDEVPEMIRGKTGFASSGGLEIWFESIPPDGPARGSVLLLMSMGGNALFWPPKFIQDFLDAGYQVIRYDQRGTGMSDWVKDWDSKHPYTLADLAQDAVAVLNALEIDRAHLVGLSMGGMVAQEVAIHHPERAASLTLMMTSGYIGDADQPGLSSRYFWKTVLKGLPLLRYRILGGEENLIRETIAKTTAAAGGQAVDVRKMAETVLYDLRKRRGINFKAVLQHQAAVNLAGSRYEKLKTLTIPTLVVHGTADEVTPVEHGKKLVELIPGAKGMWLEGIGHMFPVPAMETLMTRILAHLEGER